MTIAAAASALPGIDRSLWRSIDRTFLVLLLGSMAVHFAVAALVAAQPMPVTDDVVEAAPPTRRITLPLPVPKTATGPATTPTPTTPTTGPRPPRPGPRIDPRAVGLVGVIGKQGTTGAFQDVLGEQGVSSLKTALDGAQSLDVAGVTTVVHRKDGSGPTTTGIDPITTDGTTTVKLGERGATGPLRRPEAVFEPTDFPDDLSGLQQFVAARKKALQYCYERELTRRPGLKGRLVVRVTIDGPGRPAGVDVNDEGLGSDAVASCVRTIVRGWVLPFDVSTTVDLPFVFDQTR